MIKKFILPVLAILLLGSCANKFSLVKRKYNKGYYLDMSRNNGSKKTETEKFAAMKPKKTNSVSTKEEAAPELKVSTITSEPVQDNIAYSPLTKSYKSEKHSEPVTASVKKTPVPAKASIRSVGEKTSSGKSAKGDSNGNLILMVILCFFPLICLIPVYLHDGKKITANFWITLLLHLTFIGYIIYALLVVLDVVDLS